MVLDGTVHFAADNFGISDQRMKVVDFLKIREGAVGRLYIKDPIDTFDWGVYIMPLMKDAWVAILLFCLLVPFLMVIAVVDCKYNNKSVKSD